MIEHQAHLICDKCKTRFHDIFKFSSNARWHAKQNGWTRIWKGHGLGSGYQDYCQKCSVKKDINEA